MPILFAFALNALLPASTPAAPPKTRPKQSGPTDTDVRAAMQKAADFMIE